MERNGKGVYGWVDLVDILPITGTTTQPSNSALKSIDEIAKEVIAGKWGNGQGRANLLTVAGYDANAVQQRVNNLLK